MTSEGLEDHKASWVTPDFMEVNGHSELDDVLAERGGRYGEFKDHARLSQELKRTMQSTAGWIRLNDAQKESLEMIVHKVARILNGDPKYRDSWVDIAGYAELVAEELKD